jgi:hypothetical protein
MAQADWTELGGGLSSGSVSRGITGGITAPNGGGTFIFGFNSLDVLAGAVGFFTNQTNFAPMAKGGSVRGCVQRGVSAGRTNFTPFLFIGLGGTDVSGNCYMLGLQDANPSRIALRKGQLSGGIPDGATGTLGILRRSTASVAEGAWTHLRLDMVVNVSGDVVLNVYQNDLTANSCLSPVWAAVAGMDSFVDDALGINTGSPPYTSGRAGFAFASKDVSRRGFFDTIEVLRQL